MSEFSQVSSLAELRRLISHWKNRGHSIAFVPTMGNLHSGHLQLLRRARELADRSVVSVFVNPTQFGPGEDYADYPRSLDADAERLRAGGCNLMFAPDVETMYPGGSEAATRVVAAPALIQDLCGRRRPGHFDGVVTVVARLFNMVQPDVALFGEKDYQQLLVIQRMVLDLAFPLQLVGIATVRDPDGLAKSSRNQYLSATERALAPALYRTLQQIADQITAGERDYSGLQAWGMESLSQSGFRPDYLAIRQSDTLTLPDTHSRSLRLLAAAYLGKTRLIDNIGVEISE